jgi:hypothetical protein
MDFWQQLLSNQPFMAGFTGWFFAQFIKVIGSFNEGFSKKTLKRFVATGGFPSSHSATVAALATSCGLNFGFASGYFAIAAALAAIVIYDAFTLRFEAGKQAAALNQIIDDIYANKGLQFGRLKELVGHTRVEAFVGFILGIMVAVAFYTF